MSTFKVGDKVKVIKKVTDTHIFWSENMDVFVGRNFTIKEVDLIAKSVRLDGAEYSPTKYNWRFPFEAIELVEDKVVKFKAGDKVKVSRIVPESTVYWSEKMDQYVGGTYTVEAITERWLQLEGVQSTDGYKWKFPLDALELIEDEGDFKEGDFVKIVRAGKDGTCWIDGMEILIGNTYKVSIVDTDNTLQIISGFSLFWLPFHCCEKAEFKYIDGVQVSEKVFARRTAAPLEMTLKEVQEKLGMFVKLK